MTQIKAEIKRKSTECLKGAHMRSVALVFSLLPAWFFSAGLKSIIHSSFGIEAALISPGGISDSATLSALGLLLLCSFSGILTFSIVFYNVMRWHYARVNLLPRQKRVTFWEALRAAALSAQILTASVFYFVVFSFPSFLLLAFCKAANAGFVFQADKRFIFTLQIVAVMLLPALLLLCVLFLTRYFLCFFLLCENKKMPLREIIHTSAEFTTGVRGEILVFIAGFLPKLLLCLLIIPAFFFLPQIFCSISLYAKYLIEKGNAAAQTAF